MRKQERQKHAQLNKIQGTEEVNKKNKGGFDNKTNKSVVLRRTDTILKNPKRKYNIEFEKVYYLPGMMSFVN